jgi:hypothetical protein
VHGYYGKAVFVTGEQTKDVLLREDGCVLIHPDWFLQRFIKTAEQHIQQVVREEANGSLRRNALRYISILLNEGD